MNSTLLDPSTDQTMATVRQQIYDNAVLNTPYIIMNGLATIVACYGLFESSTAVVIGAMVIATLLGPITGIALAMVEGETTLLKKSLFAEIIGALVVLFIAVIIGHFHKDLPLNNEILSRTSPNILDLMIALAGGAAGAYASVSPRISGTLVGVAIATALVPPLSVCGLMLARGENSLAGGSFILFFTNLVAIQFTSAVILWLHGYRRKENQNQEDAKKYLLRHGISLALLILLATVLGFDFSKSLAKLQFESKTRSVLLKELENYPGVYLADLRYHQIEKRMIVTAVVRTPYSFTPERVSSLEAKFSSQKDFTIELHIRSVLTKETTKEGYVNNSSETEYQQLTR